MKTTTATNEPAMVEAWKEIVERHAHLIRQLMPVMENISGELGLAVSLGALLEQQKCGIILAHVPARQAFSFHLNPGVRFFLHTSAPGKALMASLPPERLKKLLADLTLERFNERTITDRRTLMRVIDEVRKAGYGWDLAERFDGSHCVSIPVLSPTGEPLAAVWAHGPSLHIPKEKFPAIAEVLHRWLDGHTWTLTPIKRGDNTAAIHSIVEKAKKAMAQDLATNLDLKTLAANQHISYTWFRRLFKQITGTSPHQYQLALRMVEAESLLRKSALPVSEISARLGFDSPYYFSHLFKKKHGKSPSAFRAAPPGSKVLRSK